LLWLLQDRETSENPGDIYEVARRVKRTHSVAPSDGVLFGAVLLTINKPGLLF